MAGPTKATGPPGKKPALTWHDEQLLESDWEPKPAALAKQTAAVAKAGAEKMWDRIKGLKPSKS